MSKLVCLLEEESAAAMLRVIIPKITSLKDEDVFFILFAGKQDLEKNLVNRLRYWQVPDSVFLIVRDQDAGDCLQIKRDILNKVASAGITKRALVRIACRELEAFYLGDLAAVERGLGLSGLAELQEKEKYRHPDKHPNAKEMLRDLTKKVYQPLRSSREIAPYLCVEGGNCSPSFNALIKGIEKLVKLLGV